MKPYEHGGNVYADGVYNSAVIDFSANINPLGISKSIEKAIIDNMKSLVHYPDPSGFKLKQVISVNYGIKEENIILGNGAAELMYIFFHSERPKRVLIPVPSFSEYERAARAAGGRVEYMYMTKERDFSLDIDELMRLLPEFDVVILGNPNNPTGTLLSRTDIIHMLDMAAESGTTMLVDESFLDFLPDSNQYSVIELAESYDNLFVIRSMTKFFAIPGLRLGFGAANQRLINSMEKEKDPWNVNLLAQVAGVAALADEGYKANSRNVLSKSIREMYELLKRESQLTVYEPTVNFILVSVEKSGFTSEELVKELRQRGFLARDCSNYPGMDEFHVRFAVRLHEDNVKLINAVKNILQKHRG